MRTIKNYLLLKPIGDEEIKVGGIVMPGSTQSPFIGRGMVMKVPPDCKIKEGEKILFDKRFCAEFNYIGENLVVIKEDNILVIFDEGE